jgi:hypothetical protein
MATGTSPTPPEIRSPEQDRAAAEDAAAAAQGEEEQFDDAFDIPHKNASHDSLLRWRVRDPPLAPFLVCCQAAICRHPGVISPWPEMGPGRGANYSPRRNGGRSSQILLTRVFFFFFWSGGHTLQ